MNENKSTFESKPLNKYYIISGCYIALCFSFCLLAIEYPWLSLMISLIITYFSFSLAKQNTKKLAWIILGISSIISDILYIIAIIQLFK